MVFYASFRFIETGKNENVCLGGREVFLSVLAVGIWVKKDASMVHFVIVKYANFLFHLKKGSKCC
jgi:hypothetical protein